MPVKQLKKKNKGNKLLQFFNPKTFKGGVALFLLVFVLAGAAFLIYRSFASEAPVGKISPTLKPNQPKYLPALATAQQGGQTNTTSDSMGICYYGACYYYNSMGLTAQNANAVSVDLSIEKPILGQNDYHSLAELAVSTYEEGRGWHHIEIGWTVDRGLFGDDLPHLFTFHWVAGNPACYNICGFTSYNTKYSPGATLIAGTTGKFRIRHQINKWILSFNGVDIGHYSDDLWSGKFKKITSTQAFGEVAAISPNKPNSQMGNGKNGAKRDSAKIRNLTLYPSTAVRNDDYTYNFFGADVLNYKKGNLNQSCRNKCGMNYGGPGY